MLQLLGKTLSFVSLLALVACTGGGDKGSGGNASPGGTKPHNKEEALNQLSATHKANFEAWQKKVVKSCDASQAFGLNSQHEVEDGIDGAALISNNNGSVVFSDDKNFTILSDYNSFSGVSSTKSEETSEVNGRSYSITAETKREGSSCVVYLYGQKVYETSIYRSFNIELQYNPNVQAVTTTSNPVIKNLGTSGVSEVVQHGIYSLMAQSLKPTKDAQIFIGQKLGLNSDQAEKLFLLDEDSTSESLVKISGDSRSVWSSNEFQNLIGSSNRLKEYFDGSNRTIQLEVRLRIPQYEIGGVKNTSDNGNLKIILSAQISKNDSGFSYTLNSIQNMGLVQFSDDEALACAKDRLSVHLSTGKANVVSPTTEAIMNPCSFLSAMIEEVAYQNGFYKAALPIVLTGITPSPQTQYGGWDFTLSKLAKESLKNNKDIAAELDPTSKTKIIPVVSRYLQVLKTEIDKSKNILVIKDSVLGMGLTWAFKGQEVSGGRMAQIIQSVDNTTDVFSVSSTRLLNDLAQSPNSNDEQLSFAMNIDSTYKAEAQKALGLANDISYSDFVYDIFNQVIQKRVSVEEFRDWSSKFSTVKSEINKYGNLNSVKGDVVRLSIKWLRGGEVAVQDLGSIYASLNNSADPFVESTQQLIKDLGQSFGANKEALTFAKNLSAEYKQLAIAIKNNSAAAEYESWGKNFFNNILQQHPSLDQLRQWNELWVATLAFIQREKAKIADDHSSSPEWYRKKVIEIAIKEVWSGQEYTVLESISLVAKSKIGCDRYNDASSLADCAGMSLFSKNQKKFFDPSYAGRYSVLALDFNTYMNKLSDFDWASLRLSLMREFFGSWEPIWSKCDASLFAQKSAALKSQINTIVVEEDQLKKWDLERQIKETIKNCQ